MTLEENVQQLRDALTVNTAMTLRHETRLKAHQQWLEDNELAWARHRIMMAEHAATMAKHDAKMAEHAATMADHAAKIGEFDENMTRLSAAQLVTEEKLQGLIDALKRGGNGHG